MLEINRLKPMVENYDPIKFKRLYDITENLRRKLCSQIDCRRFGVDQEEVKSWFTVKFIYAYNKYCHQYDEETLKGHLIKAMQFMKCRVLRAAYQPKYSQSIIEYDPAIINEESTNPFETDTRDHYYNALCNFLKEQLSDNAYMIFQVQINPPIYIISAMKEMGLENIHKIPDQVICNYFNLGFDTFGIKYLKGLREEIKEATKLAKEHFSKN